MPPSFQLWVLLNQESAKLCTFNTPFRRYMFKRLSFAIGLSSAQDVFQRVINVTNF